MIGRINNKILTINIILLILNQVIFIALNNYFKLYEIAYIDKYVYLIIHIILIILITFNLIIKVIVGKEIDNNE